MACPLCSIFPQAGPLRSCKEPLSSLTTALSPASVAVDPLSAWSAVVANCMPPYLRARWLWWPLHQEGRRASLCRRIPTTLPAEPSDSCSLTSSDARNVVPLSSLTMIGCACLLFFKQLRSSALDSVVVTLRPNTPLPFLRPQILRQLPQEALNDLPFLLTPQLGVTKELAALSLDSLMNGARPFLRAPVHVLVRVLASLRQTNPVGSTASTPS